jgi:hypothetical protein
VEGTSQAVLGSSNQRKVPASLSLFLKSEKLPALFKVGKGPKDRRFCDFQLVPSAYWPWAQISWKGLYVGPYPIQMNQKNPKKKVTMARKVPKP